MTIVVGFIVGMVIKTQLPPSMVYAETNMYFNPIFFQLFLLPPIIFEAGYGLNMALFGKHVWKILSLAVFGTLISTAVTWFALYTDSTDFLIDLSFSESGQFAALISAIDPVATLALFGALKVDPDLNSIVVGESVLNDAVALISFRAVTHFGVHLKDEYESIVFSFIITGVGSAIMGIVVGFAGALTFKVMGMGKRAAQKNSSTLSEHDRDHIASDLPHVECLIFVALAYISFVGAELPENSGIVASLFTGFTMRAYARPNLSAKARGQCDSLLKALASLSENTVYILVGLALTIELEYVTNETLEGTTLEIWDSVHAFVYVIVLAVAVRAVHLFPIIFGFNAFQSHAKDRVPFSHQIVMWFSGLRGAIAVALAYQVEGDNEGGTANNKHIIRAATMMTVVFTTFAFGGCTPCLLEQLKIDTGVDPPKGEAKTEEGSIFRAIEDVLVDPDIAKLEGEEYKPLAA
uniref:Cation/H+ exchanger transmembrane domain-containing protein n=1 Tax=Haptolina brevifila TaxID=156173 RepID=A0A7S2J4X9_9EUKA